MALAWACQMQDFGSGACGTVPRARGAASQRTGCLSAGNSDEASLRKLTRLGAGAREPAGVPRPSGRQSLPAAGRAGAVGVVSTRARCGRGHEPGHRPTPCLPRLLDYGRETGGQVGTSGPQWLPCVHTRSTLLPPPRAWPGSPDAHGTKPRSQDPAGGQMSSRCNRKYSAFASIRSWKNR